MKRRRTHPKKLMKTKEEMEMMNQGLFDDDNILITNHEEIVSSRNYRRRIEVISEIIYHKAVVYHWERTRGKRNTTCGLDQFQRRTGQCIPEGWKYDILPDCDDGTDESPECVPLEYHPGQFQCTGTLKCIPSGWMCDGEPDYGASDKQIIDNSDEDPHKYFSCNTTYGPETYWCIKHYDRGSRISLAANKGIAARKMKYKTKARDVTSAGTMMKTMVIRTMRATEVTDYG